MRAQSLLLSSKGYGMDDLANMFEVSRNTVSLWIDKWEQEGVTSVYDHARSGAPMKLTDAEIDVVTHLITEHPNSPKMILAKIREQVKNTISISTLKRIVKKHRLRWKRVRKSLRHQRDDDEFEQATHDIEQFQRAQQAGQLELVYFDESGCSLQSQVPYAYQPIGETLTIPASQRQRLNILGFFNTTNQLDAFSFECNIDADIVVACIDEFSHHLVKNTVLVLDNSPIHRSEKVEASREQWKSRGVSLYYLPKYAPELNLIEILWRFITYHWLPLSAYLSFQCLVNAVEDVLKHVGTTYQINFT
jgi:transposase